MALPSTTEPAPPQPAPSAPARVPQALNQARALLLTGSGTLLNVGLTIFRIKLVAVYLGPEGTASLAQVNNVASIAGIVASLGVPAALVQRVARADGLGDRQASQTAVGTATGLAGVLSLAVALAQVAIIPFAGTLLLEGEASYRTLLLLSALSVPLAGLSAILTASLNGRRLVKALTAAGLLGAVTAALCAYPFIRLFGAAGAVGLGLLQASVSIAYAAWVLRSEASDLFAAFLRPRQHATRLELREMLRFGVLATLAGMVPLWALLAGRTLLVQHTSLQEAGLFQSAYSFSQQYASLFLGSVGVYLMPALAASQTAEQLSEAVRHSLRLILKTGVPVIILAIALDKWVLQLAYSKKFLGASDQLELQLVADVLKIASWHFATVLISRGDMPRFLAVESTWSTVFVVVVYATVDSAARAAGSYGFVAGYVAYVAVTYLFAHRRYGLRLGGTWGGVALAQAAVIAALVVSRLGGDWARLGVAALAAAALARNGSAMFKEALQRKLRRLEAAKGASA